MAKESRPTFTDVQMKGSKMLWISLVALEHIFIQVGYVTHMVNFYYSNEQIFLGASKGKHTGVHNLKIVICELSNSLYIFNVWYFLVLLV